MVLHDPYKEIALGSLGGEDNLVQLEIDNLRKLGHEVFDERAFDKNLRKKINQLRAQSYGSTPDVLKKIKYFKPDVIHTHNLNQRSGYKWMQFSNVPIIFFRNIFTLILIMTLYILHNQYNQYFLSVL